MTCNNSSIFSQNLKLCLRLSTWQSTVGQMDLCADLIMLHAERNLADMLICEDILHATSWISHCRRFLDFWNTSAIESTFILGVVYMCYGFVHDFHFNTQITESCMLWFQSVWHWYDGGQGFFLWQILATWWLRKKGLWPVQRIFYGKKSQSCHTWGEKCWTSHI